MRGIWALFTRSLRLDARDRWAHGLRGVALLLGAVALFSAQKQAAWYGAPGLRFFQMLVMMDAWLILLAGIGYFSSTITEEKEENTLGLMMMTGLSPLGLLLGKAGGRLVQAVYLILLQIPLALLAITLGGITLSQIFAALMALIALLFFVGNLALLCSVLCRTTRSAALAMIILAVIYGAGAWLCESMTWQLARLGVNSPTLTLLCDMHCFRRITFLFESAARPKLISPCEVAFLIGGCVCFVLSWALFGWAVRQPDSTPVTRAWWMARNPRFRLVSPGRVWPMAIAWKELFFTLGGWQQLVLKACGYLALLVMIAVVNSIFERGIGVWRQTQEMAVVCFSLAMALEGSVLASRVFSEEIRQQTWSSLYLTPFSMAEILPVKWAAVLVGLLPVALMDFAVIFTSALGVRNFVNILDDAMFYGIVAMFIACSQFAAVFSLYVRWGAVPLGGAVVWMSFALMMMLGDPGLRERDAAGVAIAMSLLACVVCQFWIYFRLEELASQ